MQAVGFRDVYEKTASADAIMLGVSTDSVEKFRNFGDRLGLPFLLASDATGAAEAPEAGAVHGYHAWPSLLPGPRSASGEAALAMS